MIHSHTDTPSIKLVSCISQNYYWKVNKLNATLKVMGVMVMWVKGSLKWNYQWFPLMALMTLISRPDHTNYSNYQRYTKPNRKLPTFYKFSMISFQLFWFVDFCGFIHRLYLFYNCTIQALNRDTKLNRKIT